MNYHEFISTKNTLIEYNGPGGNIIIPDNIKRIGNHVFFNNYNINSITIPEGVTDVSYASFARCKFLKTVKLPSTLKRIDRHAFSYCPTLELIEIPEGVTTIGHFAFSGCSGLKKIVVPESVTNIEKDIFNRCNNVTIYTPKDSYMELYASAYNLNYITI